MASTIEQLSFLPEMAPVAQPVKEEARNTSGMDFIDVQGYALTNAGHQQLNRATMLKLKSLLPGSLTGLSVLDIGCGTGETTFALAQGQLGDLGVPASVLGVDQSVDMVKASRRLGDLTNLTFEHKNLDQLAKLDNRFDVITAFSSLHWEPDQQRLLDTIRRLLKPGGYFAFVIAGTFDTERNIHRMVFDGLKKDNKWAETLKQESWPHLGVKFENTTGWNSTIDQTGAGFIREKDYVPLLISKGFEVLHSETSFPPYLYSEAWAEGYLRDVVLSGLPTLHGAKRKAFLEEYVARIQESVGGGWHFTKPLASGFAYIYCDAVTVIGRPTASKRRAAGQ